MDLCPDLRNAADCQVNDYMNLAFMYQSTILQMVGMGRTDFVDWWSGTVGTYFGIEKDTILGLYDRSNDAHNTEMNTRYLWKYGAARGVSGTPVAFVNGVKLDEFPTSVDSWIDLLQSLVDAQWSGETEASYLQ